jgi:hypothetical protein
VGVLRKSHAEKVEHKPAATSTFFGNRDNPPAQQFLTSGGDINNDPCEGSTPQDRPRIDQRPLRTFFDTSALGPVSPLSTHRAAYMSTPQAQAKRAAEIAIERERQTDRQRFSLEWLMSKLTGSK